MAIRGQSRMQESCKFLIQNHADVNVLDSYGCPAVMVAVQEDNTTALKQLISAKANIHVTYNGDTLLMSAISERSVDAVEILVDAGADPNEKDTYGHTVFKRIEEELEGLSVVGVDDGWDYTNNKPVDDPAELQAIDEMRKRIGDESFSLVQIRESLSQVSGTYSSDFARVLSLSEPRMQGDDVLALQEQLLSLSFSEVGEADGWYGPLTKGAVEKFQRYAGIAYDGVVRQ
jgi:hypothetical protein